MGTTQNKYQSTLPWNTPAVKKLASNLTSAFSYKPSSGNMSGDMYILNGLKNTGSDIVDYYNRNRQAMADPAKRASAMNNLVTNGIAQRNVAVPRNATDVQAVSSGYTPQYNPYAPSQFKLNGDYGTGATAKKTGIAGTTGVAGKTTAFGSITDAQYNQNSPYVSALGFDGMQPNDVSAMQKSLGVNADGRFGANTANALVNAGMQPAMIGASSDQEYMDAMKTPATSQTYNPSDYSGNDWSSVGSNQNGSMMSGLSDYLGNVNSDGFWSHNVGNMPEGLSDVEKAAWLQSPSTFSNILGGVGTGASALSSLYGMYMQNKNYNLQKDAYNKQVAMARASEGRMSDFAKAMGGSYRTANI